MSAKLRSLRRSHTGSKGYAELYPSAAQPASTSTHPATRIEEEQMVPMPEVPEEQPLSPTLADRPAGKKDALADSAESLDSMDAHIKAIHAPKTAHAGSCPDDAAAQPIRADAGSELTAETTPAYGIAEPLPCAKQDPTEEGALRSDAAKFFQIQPQGADGGLLLPPVSEHASNNTTAQRMNQAGSRAEPDQPSSRGPLVADSKSMKPAAASLSVDAQHHVQKEAAAVARDSKRSSGGRNGTVVMRLLACFTGGGPPLETSSPFHEEIAADQHAAKVARKGMGRILHADSSASEQGQWRIGTRMDSQVSGLISSAALFMLTAEWILSRLYP